jgi:putative membrane protein
MDFIRALPAVNATLNGLAGVLLLAGYVQIRRKKVAAHRACMLAAFSVSALFLASYLTYHAQAGSTAFRGQGWIRPVYFLTLLTHIVLAAAIVPMAVVTLRRGWRGDVARHRALARRTLPLWMYVSVTGVAIYWMLYHGFRNG